MIPGIPAFRECFFFLWNFPTLVVCRLTAPRLLHRQVLVNVRQLLYILNTILYSLCADPPGASEDEPTAVRRWLSEVHDKQSVQECFGSIPFSSTRLCDSLVMYYLVIFLFLFYILVSRVCESAASGKEVDCCSVY